MLLYHQLALKWPRQWLRKCPDFETWSRSGLACKLIINSSLPIGCQFIWETKLTLKSHKIILEKSWWSFLVVVVAIVIAVVIAVVVVVVIAIVIVKV